MSKYVPVKGFSGLVRDTDTNAILNTNRSEIEQARERKRIKKQKQLEAKQLKNEVASLRQDMSELKDMMKMFISKLDK